MRKGDMAYEMTIRVQYYDTDAMGIVHHANYIRYFETARTEMLRSKGYPYDRIEDEGMYMPVLSVNADFRTPAVYDEVLVLACRVSRVKGASVELEYEIRSAETGEVHVTGESRHGFTTKDFRPVRLKKDKPEIYRVFTEAMEDSEEVQ